MDTITLLKTKGGLPLTKRFTADGEESYGGSKHYSVHPHPVSDLDDMRGILEKLTAQRDVAFIRGTPVADLDLEYAQRVEANFESRPQHLLALDIDSAETTADPLFDTESACVEWIAKHLPEPFHDTSFIYQMTSSAGIKPGLRARIWFWLSQPRSSIELKPWAQCLAADKASCLDASLFDAVKLHYTAAPIFEGRPDPFQYGRINMYRGLFDTVDGFTPVDTGVRSLPMAGRLDPLLLVARPVDKPVEVIKAYLEEGTEAGILDPDDYEDWVTVGRCLHHQFRGDHEGWEIWDEWSGLSGKYAGMDETVYRWRSFDTPEKRGKRPQTFATIIARVQEAAVVVDELAIYNAKVSEAATEADVYQLLSEFSGSSITRNALIARGVERLKELFGGSVIVQKGMVEKEVKSLRDQKAKELLADVENELATIAAENLTGSLHHVKFFGGQFWAFLDGVWRRVDESAIRRSIHDALKTDPYDDPELKRLQDQAKRSGRGTSTTVAAAAATLAHKTGEDGHADPLDLMCRRYPSRSVVNCNNGEVWIDDNGRIDFYEHDADHHLTHKIDVDYDPTAEAPIWDRALKTAFKNAEDPEGMVRHLEEIFGYMVQTRRDVEAVWVMFYGPTGDNGKSQIAGVLSRLLNQAVSNKSLDDLDRSQHSTSDLVGKLALVDDDYTADKVLQDGWLKKLSEDKLLTANPKHKDEFQFRSRVITIQLTNQWPKCRTFDGGIRRRAQIFPFTYKIPQEDQIKGLANLIVEQEAAGVLNRLIAGWQRVLKRGRRFDMPADCQRALREWVTDSADAAAFLTEFIEPVGIKDATLRIKDEVYEQYQYWANSHGYRPLGPRKFGNQVRDLASQFGLICEEHRKTGETNGHLYLLGARFRTKPKEAEFKSGFGVKTKGV